jgi:hypothetical protein
VHKHVRGGLKLAFMRKDGTMEQCEKEGAELHCKIKRGDGTMCRLDFGVSERGAEIIRSQGHQKCIDEEGAKKKEQIKIKGLDGLSGEF